MPWLVVWIWACCYSTSCLGLSFLICKIGILLWFLTYSIVIMIKSYNVYASNTVYSIKLMLKHWVSYFFLGYWILRSQVESAKREPKWVAVSQSIIWTRRLFSILWKDLCALKLFSPYLGPYKPITSWISASPIEN